MILKKETEKKQIFHLKLNSDSYTSHLFIVVLRHFFFNSQHSYLIKRQGITTSQSFKKMWQLVFNHAKFATSVKF